MLRSVDPSGRLRAALNCELTARGAGMAPRLLNDCTGFPGHSVKAHCGHIEKHPPSGRGGNLIGVQE